MNNPPDESPDALDAAMRTILSHPGDGVPRLEPDERSEMLGGLIRQARAPSKKFIFFSVLLGILLPLGTVIAESIGHFCAELFFDPIPTLGHALLCASVPVVNLLLFLQLIGKLRMPHSLRSALVGLSFGVSLFYIVTFVKMLPVIGIGLVAIVIGIGLLALLPLSPHFGALYSWWISRKINRNEGTPGWHPLVGGGFAVGLASMLVVAAIHYQRVDAFDKLAKSDVPASPDEVQALGNLVSQSWMKQAIHHPPVRVPGLSKRTWDRNWTQTHSIYYQLYGQSEQSFYRPPRNLGGHEWIGGLRRNLKLAASDMAGWVDSEAGLGYVEWTQEFVNYRDAQAEGRQHIELPPGGVVSRVTLWVNGEPREAAFDTVAKTRAAYEYIVARKRDPVLVNALSGDRIQIECFPVPPITNNVPGRMKFRIGISFPLPALSRSETEFHLPRILNRNFLFAEDLEHTLELNSQHPIEGMKQTGVMIHQGTFEAKEDLQGRWGPVRPESRNTLSIPREPAAGPVVAIDPVTGQPVVSELEDIQAEVDASAPPRIAIVVDRNAPLKRYVREIAALKQQLPPTAEVRWFMEDGRPLEADSFEGGGDAVPVLLEAANWYAESHEGCLIWLHGGQPFQIADCDALVNRLMTKQLRVQSIRVIDEPNYIADRLAHDNLIHEHEGPLAKAFASALDTQRTKAGLMWVRQRAAADAVLPDTQTMPELAKLLAHEEILTGLATTAPDHDALSKKAVAYKLVTPVSAAIVLESREEYLQHGLKPPEDDVQGQVAKHVGKFGNTVPEPSTLMMLLFGSGLLLGMRRFREWRRTGTLESHS